MKKKTTANEALLRGLIYLGRFALIFLFNSFLAWMWYIYEEKPATVDEVTRTLVIVFLFGNIALSALLSYARFFKRIERFIDLGVDKLYGGRRELRSLREESLVKLNRVRHFKMQRRYDRALSAVNEVLEADPDYPDAIYLKATIMWEGFENAGAAKTYLVKVMKMVEDHEESLHRWSHHLFMELNEKEKRKGPRE